MDLGTTGFTSVTDVTVNQTFAIYASGQRTDSKFGLAVLGHPALGTVPTPVFIEVQSEVQRIADDFVAGPGNYPLDLTLDTLTLYVTGNNEIFVYNASPLVPPTLATTVANSGSKTIATASGGGVFVVGAGDAVRAGTSVLGAAAITGSLTFPGTFTIRGVAVRSTDAGTFALVCAGNGGLRVVQIPRSSGS
jgi:hypothetical protein